MDLNPTQSFLFNTGSSHCVLVPLCMNFSLQGLVKLGSQQHGSNLSYHSIFTVIKNPAAGTHVTT